MSTAPKMPAAPAQRVLLLAAVALVVLALGGLAWWFFSGAPDPREFFHPAPQAEPWLVADYGFYGDAGHDSAIANIDTPARAQRMLEFLDRRLSGVQGAYVPADLAAALGQIGAVAPDLARQPAFHRLETLAGAKHE